MPTSPCLQETYGLGRHRDSERGNQDKQWRAEKAAAVGRGGQDKPYGNQGSKLQKTGDAGQGAAAAGGGASGGGGGGVKVKREVPRVAMMKRTESQGSAGMPQPKQEQPQEQEVKLEQQQQQQEEEQQKQADIEKEAEMLLDELYAS